MNFLIGFVQKSSFTQFSRNLSFSTQNRHWGVGRGRSLLIHNTGTCGYTYTLEYIAWRPLLHLMIFFYSFLELFKCFQMCLLFVSDFINSHICSVVFQWLCLRHGDCVAVAIINVERNVQVTLQYCLTIAYYNQWTLYFNWIIYYINIYVPHVLL